MQTNRGTSLSNSLAAGLSIALSLLPRVACPCCWPAYSAVVSGVGLGFLVDSTQFTVVSILSLGAGLAVLAWQPARSRGGYKPLGLGVIAAVAIVFGKFIVDDVHLNLLGSVLLVASYVWRGPILPRKGVPMATAQSCQAACCGSHPSAVREPPV